MITIMEGFIKGDGAPRGVDRDIMKIIKKTEHEIPNIETFIPTPSNDKEVRDVPLCETFVNTMEKGTNTSSITPKECFLQITWGFWQNDILK
jgi:hypothetical protein